QARVIPRRHADDLVQQADGAEVCLRKLPAGDLLVRRIVFESVAVSVFWHSRMDSDEWVWRWPKYIKLYAGWKGRVSSALLASDEADRTNARPGVLISAADSGTIRITRAKEPAWTFRTCSSRPFPKGPPAPWCASGPLRLLRPRPTSSTRSTESASTR